MACWVYKVNGVIFSIGISIKTDGIEGIWNYNIRCDKSSGIRVKLMDASLLLPICKRAISPQLQKLFRLFRGSCPLF
jgi:hypothetical protein